MTWDIILGLLVGVPLVGMCWVALVVLVLMAKRDIQEMKERKR